MKITLITLTFLWTVFWLFMGISIFIDTPKQIGKDKNIINQQINPSVDFIKNFKNRNHRLPTNREFYCWESNYYKDYSSDLKQKNDSLISSFGAVQYIRSSSNIVSNDLYKFKNADWKKDFAISVWRGEWTEYYFSWTNSYDSNNYSWYDGFIGLILMIALGLFPWLLWWFNIKKHKSSTQQKYLQ